MCEFSGVEAVESTLTGLMGRTDGPFVARLPRAAGARESRYTHLFFGAVESAPADPEPANPPSAGSEQPGGPTLAQRVALLEESVAELKREIEALKYSR